MYVYMLDGDYVGGEGERHCWPTKVSNRYGVVLESLASYTAFEGIVMCALNVANVSRDWPPVLLDVQEIGRHEQFQRELRRNRLLKVWDPGSFGRIAVLLDPVEVLDDLFQDGAAGGYETQ